MYDIGTYGSEPPRGGSLPVYRKVPLFTQSQIVIYFIHTKVSDSTGEL